MGLVSQLLKINLVIGDSKLNNNKVGVIDTHRHIRLHIPIIETLLLFSSALNIYENR